MTDTTEPKPSEDKAMSEQIKPVENICCYCGELIPMAEIGAATIDGDPAHIVCALKDMDEVGFDIDMGG